MVKAGAGHDPLLRRPFSVFEILRDARRRADRHLAPQQAHRRRRRRCSTTRAPGSASPASARSAGRSRSSTRRPRPGWSPAASASRRSRRSPQSLRARGVASTLFYGARRARGALLPRLLPRPRRRARADDRGRQRSASAAASSRRSIGGSPRARRRSPVMLYACGPEGMLAATARDRRAPRPAVRGVGRADHGLRPRRLLQLRRADARRRRRAASRALVPRRPGARRATRSCWD